MSPSTFASMGCSGVTTDAGVSSTSATRSADTAALGINTNAIDSIIKDMMICIAY